MERSAFRTCEPHTVRCARGWRGPGTHIIPPSAASAIACCCCMTASGNAKEPSSGSTSIVDIAADRTTTNKREKAWSPSQLPAAPAARCEKGGRVPRGRRNGHAGDTRYSQCVCWESARVSGEGSDPRAVPCRNSWPCSSLIVTLHRLLFLIDMGNAFGGQARAGE